MSVGSLGGIVASASGAPLAQTKGSETERAEQSAGAVDRKAVSEQKAESAAGVGETDGSNHETNERDADGRRPWQIARRQPDDSEPAEPPPRAKDASGLAGNLLDLSG